jgi:hypothetical protein
MADRSRVCAAPNHSALYVVDLEKLRKTAAGDQLRVIYDNLSRDPNSLANLDQDLPNYAQHQVRSQTTTELLSLPREAAENWVGGRPALGVSGCGSAVLSSTISCSSTH